MQSTASYAAAIFFGAILLASTVLSTGPVTALGQIPQFNILKPSTTGIPGEEVRIMKFDPAGNLWVVGRHYFWEETGLAMLSADQLAHNPLPGGGFDTGAWKVWSNVHHPIPSVYSYDLEFSGDGNTLWLATEGGLVRVDGTRFVVFDRSVPGFESQRTGALREDRDGTLWAGTTDAC